MFMAEPGWLRLAALSISGEVGKKRGWKRREVNEKGRFDITKRKEEGAEVIGPFLMYYLMYLSTW